MPMTPAQQRSSLASSGEIVIVWLLEIAHEEIDTIRLARADETVTHAGNVYQAFGFEVVPPVKSSEEMPALKITVNIVDQRVMAALRALRGQKDVSITLLRVGSDDFEFESYRGTFEYEGLMTDSRTKATITASFMTGALGQQYPARMVAPSNVSPY